MSLFHVGQMVVCVDDDARRDSSGPVTVRRGMIYTIREIFDERPWPLGLMFEEIVTPFDPRWRAEPPFFADRFRPVKTTSIEIFRKLVAPTPELVD